MTNDLVKSDCTDLVRHVNKWHKDWGRATRAEPWRDDPKFGPMYRVFAGDELIAVGWFNHNGKPQVVRRTDA
jgi:hypothetical protein